MRSGLMLSKTQQIVLGFFAAIVGLTVAAIVHADFLAGVGLVALAYVVVGVGFAMAKASRG
jgi:hypothetical protein